MTAREASRCVLCGEPEPFGLSICPGCGGAAHAVGDTLVFIRPADTDADARRVDHALDQLLEGRAHLSEHPYVASGHRALIRVPAAAAETAVRQLALKGIPAETRNARRAWAPIPHSFAILVGAVAVVGMIAGITAEPFLRWVSPLYAGLLAMAAQVRLRQPAIRIPYRRTPYPLRVERALAETFARLPLGSARDFLVRLVHAAEPLYAALRRGGPPPRRKDVEELLSMACRAAEDLSDLEHGLMAVGAGPGAERLTGLRDRLVAKFRDGIAVLHRLRAETIADDPAHQELARLVTALGEDATALADARREIAALALEEPPGA